jgi:RNA polymerase sigma-70 factor (ECF subfamily)
VDVEKGSGDATTMAMDPVLAAARAGDRKAMSRWLAQHEDAIYRFALRMCRDEEAAKDVLQESMIAAARNLSSFRGDSAPTTWLFTITRSFCGKQRRRRKGEPAQYEPLVSEAGEEIERAPFVDAARTPDVAAEGAEIDRAITDAIDELEASQRDVLVLRDVEGLSANEVGEVLGLSVEAVKSRLHRARVRLRERLAPMLEPKLPPPSAGCPDLVPLFSRHLEGDLEATTCAEMERHLAICPRCRGACDSLRRTLSRCASGLGAVPEEVRLEVRRAVENFLYSSAT